MPPGTPSIEEMNELLATTYMRLVIDNFMSTDRHVETTAGSAYIDNLIHEKTLATGVAQGSVAAFRYDHNIFNPHYAELLMKVQISNPNNVFAFWGYKETKEAPTFNMTESHAGFMVKDGKLYISTGDSSAPTPNQQRLEITGWDVTNWLLYKIVKSEFWMRPLPIKYPYFGDIRVIEVARKWSLVGKLDTVVPLNMVHYLCFYITNGVNADRWMRISHILYGERYAD